jgi:fructosamine-3-kinase
MRKLARFLVRLQNPAAAAPRRWALRARLEELLHPAEADGPSLLHGDLWSGNVLATTSGPALVDPAAYFGHREVDLAMADLFGGFDGRFRQAYEAAWPLQPGYARRRDVYQLYYLLVHVNLFGAGYLPATKRTLRRLFD